MYGLELFVIKLSIIGVHTVQRIHITQSAQAQLVYNEGCSRSI